MTEGVIPDQVAFTDDPPDKVLILRDFISHTKKSCLNLVF
jgi:hypothetical protein